MVSLFNLMAGIIPGLSNFLQWDVTKKKPFLQLGQPIYKFWNNAYQISSGCFSLLMGLMAPNLKI
jgi:hypothetical protein